MVLIGRKASTSRRPQARVYGGQRLSSYDDKHTSHRSNVDGREHILEHGGHELHVHALAGEAVEHDQRRVLEGAHHHVLLAEGRDHVAG